MNQIETQIRELSPSAKEALFRRLMVEETVSYLREKNGIYGFEVELRDDQALSGFAIIGVQKHTIYAFCSDMDEDPKLILFPPIEKLFDPAFDLLKLHVVKRFITDSSFTGTNVGSGVLQNLVADLTPPIKQIDVPNDVLNQMMQRIKDINEGRTVVEKVEPEPVKAPVEAMVDDEEPPIMDEEPPIMDDGFDDYQEFEEGGDFDDYSEPDEDYELYDEPPVEEEQVSSVPAEDPRSTKLKGQTFNSLSEVSDYCEKEFGINHPLAVTLVNKTLQSNVSPEYRIDLAIKLFCKLFDTQKI